MFQVSRMPSEKPEWLGGREIMGQFDSLRGLAVCLGLAGVIGTARGEPPQVTGRPALLDLATARPMNGVDPRSMGAFWEKWRLVTVRYRQDNGEQRFIFANDIAWEAIKLGKKDFPEGSVLGKVAFATKPDQVFPNSVEPHGLSRIQLMKKEAGAHAATGGWGYAMYLPNISQETGGDHDGSMAGACHACHQLVSQRDFVFSRPTFLQDSEVGEVATSKVSEALFEDQFQLVAVTSLPAYSRAVLSELGVTQSQIKYHAMPLFVGSLEESIGPLTSYAEKFNQPHLLADNESHHFLLVLPQPSTPACKHPMEVSMNDVLPTPVQTPRSAVPAPMTIPPPGPFLRLGTACAGVNAWTAPLPLPKALR